MNPYKQASTLHVLHNVHKQSTETTNVKTAQLHNETKYDKVSTCPLCSSLAAVSECEVCGLSTPVFMEPPRPRPKLFQSSHISGSDVNILYDKTLAYGTLWHSE